MEYHRTPSHIKEKKGRGSGGAQHCFDCRHMIAVTPVQDTHFQGRPELCMHLHTQVPTTYLAYLRMFFDCRHTIASHTFLGLTRTMYIRFWPTLHIRSCCRHTCFLIADTPLQATHILLLQAHMFFDADTPVQATHRFSFITGTLFIAGTLLNFVNAAIGMRTPLGR